MVRKLVVVVALASSLSCSIAFQDSVRSSGTQCSTSRFWYVSDFILAVAFVAAIQAGQSDTSNVSPATYIPAGLFVGSGLIGIYKRGNCVRYRETATPEMFARDEADQQRKDAAQLAAMSAMAHQMSQPSQADGATAPPPSSSAPPPTYAPPPSSYTPPPSSSSPPSQPDYFAQRNACHKECERKHDEAARACQQNWPGQDDATAKALAQCLSANAAAPFSKCTKDCDR